MDPRFIYYVVTQAKQSPNLFAIKVYLQNEYIIKQDKVHTKEYGKIYDAKEVNESIYLSACITNIKQTV